MTDLPRRLPLLVLSFALAASPRTPVGAFSAGTRIPNRPPLRAPSSDGGRRCTYEAPDSRRPPAPLSILMARYGPRDDVPPPDLHEDGDAIDDGGSSADRSDGSRERLKSEFTALLRAVLDDDSTPEESYPSLFAKNIETIIAVLEANVGGDGGTLLEEIMREDVQNSGEEDRLDRVSEAVSMMLSFVESFVEEAKAVDEVYKNLLGKIFRSIAPVGHPEKKNDGTDSVNNANNMPASAMEDRLDDLLAENAESFTPGFLRHVEGECDRISSLETVTPESARMLEVLRVIQARVLEELGKGMGEGAVVLGQLLGYDDESERLAVLDAGLAVRGVDFARELASLTEEALGGFEAVTREGNAVDPGLIEGVKAMDDRIRSFIESSEADFQ